MQSSDRKASSTVYGYPRIGANRELKRASEGFWRNEITADALQAECSALRVQAWNTMRDSGIDEIPSNTFSLYDHMLDMIELVDAVPARHREPDSDALSRYFAMARGTDEAPPLEMTKWFDTNYHYLVPEIDGSTTFSLRGTKPFDEFAEALTIGIRTRPVLVGPITFLLLSKPTDEAAMGFAPLSRLDDLLGVYEEILSRLASQGAEWVQLDEPILVTDQSEEVLDAVRVAYQRLASNTGRPKILVATYFGPLEDALPVLASSPVEGIGLDLTPRGGGNLELLGRTNGLEGKRIVAGVVDGRNVWINDLTASLKLLATIQELSDDVVVAPSCSLLHVPIDKSRENILDREVMNWLSFANQKLAEITTLTRGLVSGTESVRDALASNANALEARASSARTTNSQVRARAGAITSSDHRRVTPIAQRAQLQGDKRTLPALPTTTIGSFPQTLELRKARRDLAKGQLSAEDYEGRIRQEIAHVVELQESIGLDVLVHGEAERNDMVQYFAEQLEGYVATDQGWVQSYGSRYVRPPIIAGDLSRPNPMTVAWSTYAQSLTTKPMKGMLTGPVTMMCWSFVRDDQPWSETARQMALALRDEVNGLEAAGIGVIQVDEPALREGLPLRKAGHLRYLEWATEAFRLTTSGVSDTTQIHTHMCYAEFGEIIDAVAALDADVISLEAARSRMAITEELAGQNYPGAVGPGVYDIHAPRIPTTEEMLDLLLHAGKVISVERLWVNPDCGLKTRQEAEVVAALTNMVNAASEARSALSQTL